MKFEVDKELFPFENHFLKTDAGAEVHYVDEGQGVVVLMLHGNPTWSFLYRKMIMRMRENFRCIAPASVRRTFVRRFSPKTFICSPGTASRAKARSTYPSARVSTLQSVPRTSRAWSSGFWPILSDTSASITL